MVKVVTLVKQTPDVEAIRIDPKTGAPDLSGVGVKVSDYDKHAVEAAVQLKEKHAGSRVVAVSLGGPRLEESVKEVLAMGCDEAVLLRDAAFADVDTAGKAELLAKAIQKVGDVDLVLAAEESADSHTAQTGPRIAEHLGWPLVSYVHAFKIEGTTVKAERETDEGVEEIECPLPAVLTINESTNTPRLPALMQILQAKNKPMKVWSASDLGAAAQVPVLRRTKNVAPKMERKQQMITGDSIEDAARTLAKELVKTGVVS